MGRSPKLPTSREVYDRIRWDTRFDRAEFVVGYDHHGAEPNEVAFEAFSPGEIPWHRILYFKQAGRIVWDRRARLDLLSSISGGAQRDADSTFVARPAYRWDGALWTAAELPSAPPPSRLRVLTWNVLFDLFEAEKLDTEARIPRILDRLEHADADVIALQEVTPRFLEKLLQRPWVRARYAISEGEAAESVDPSGQLLLARHPLTNVREHRFSRAKHVLTGDVAGITFAVVHLTSDREEGAEAKRARQLDVVLDQLANAPGPVAVLGDFNAGDEATLPLRDLVDVWPALRPDEPGVTFDPKRNRLAAITTQRDLARRLDRILVRGANAQTIALFAEDEACPSDHYGVVAEIALARSIDVAPVHETAVVLVPPESAWPPIQAIREKHDRHYARWMPHITLLFGFVPESAFASALPIVEEAARSVAPFRVDLGALRSFEHARSATIWAEPATTPPRALHELQAALERAFPRCDEQSNKSDAGFTPHLSLGSVTADAARAREEWKALLPPISWTAHDVALVARRGNEPMAVVRRVPLGRAIEDACERITKGRGRVFAFGAHALGIETEESDRDLVCVAPHGTIAREAFFAELAAAFPNVEVALDALVPVARIHRLGRRTEVAFAELPEGAPLDLPRPDLSSTGVVRAMDPVSQRSIGGVLDARALLSLLERSGATDRFRRLARHVRTWARARQIDMPSLGFPSRFTWTLLAAKAAIDDADFFSLLASWDWNVPVALTDEARTYRARDRDRMIVPTLVAPVQNSARTLTRSTHAIVKSELSRATSAKDLLARPSPMAHDAWVLVRAGDEATLRAWLAKSFLPFVLELEKDPALSLRPYPTKKKEQLLALDGITPAALAARVAPSATEGIAIEACAPCE